MQDAKKQALAMEIATAAVGFTGLAPVIQAVQIGILLAWSYVESILDVRCLLSGGRIALVKAVSDWKSDVSLGEKALTEKSGETKHEEEGLNYREYLQILLVLAYRAMDIVERNVALQKPSFRMDHQIHCAQMEAVYSAQPLFLSFVTFQKEKDGIFHFWAEGDVTYLK